MTLILSCLTDDAVYQVSDRRLTSHEVPRTLIDDEVNKAILVNGNVVFGYTGRSHIGNVPADEWFTRTVIARPTKVIDELADRVAKEASVAFAKIHCASRYKRHAFQGVGWFRKRGDPTYFPGTVTIHNAIASDGSWQPHANRQFATSFQAPQVGPRAFALTAVGQRPGRRESAVIWRLLRKCVHRQVDRPYAIIEAMAMSIRWLSSRYPAPSPIGRNLMAVHMPKSFAAHYEATGEFSATLGEPIQSQLTCWDLPEHDRPVRYGPMAAVGGMAVFGFEHRCPAADPHAADGEAQR